MPEPPISRIRVPHPLVLLTSGVLLAAVASYVVPAGSYDRVFDEETGRTVVVEGTFKALESSPVGFFQAVTALPRGMAAAAEVIFLVFLIGGAFTVVEKSGALRRGIASLIGSVSGRSFLVIPIIAAPFAVGGVVQNLQEEIIPLIPALLVLTRSMGYPPIIAVAVSVGPAFIGSAFSPINPFQVQIAQRIAEIPLGSGAAFRIGFLLVALAIWVGWTMRYAAKRRRPDSALEERAGEAGLRPVDWCVLASVGAAFGIVAFGLAQWDFGLNDLSAVFVIMGVAVGMCSGLRIAGTARAFAQGFREMSLAALLIGVARAIYVVLEEGRIVDTIVHGMFSPLENLPAMASAAGMVAAQALIHVPVPSVSAQAVLTMPLLVPLSDLLQISRDVTVLAYQYGAGLCELITPTNGALMAILASSKVRFEDWIRFTLPLYFALTLVGLAAIYVALAAGL